MHPDFTPGIDVALLVLWAFFGFFFALVYYLRREDRREGYPLEDEITGRLFTGGGPRGDGYNKTFILPHDLGVMVTPTQGREPVDIAARRTERFHGAPYAPTGNPMIDGIGPASWVERAKRPDLDMEGHPRIVPLSTDTEFFVTLKDPQMTGWPVVGADGKTAGTVSDLWVDKADRLVRYIQVDLGADIGARPVDANRPADGTGNEAVGVAVGTGAVLAPMFMASVDRGRRRVVIDAITASQFADVPRIEGTQSITLYEEERVQAYFGGGYLYATRERQEPYL